MPFPLPSRLTFARFFLPALGACLLGAAVHGWADTGEAGAAGEAPATAVRGAPPVVEQVDLRRYSGRWYELARLPNSFQRHCAGDVMADYLAGADGRLRVVNQCTRGDGTVDVSTGEARQPPGTPGTGLGLLSGTAVAGMLQVRFAPRWLSWLPAVWGDYWIIGLDENYETALVGTPQRDYLWLLSRSPRRPEADIEAWLQKAADLGYPVARVQRTEQDETQGTARSSGPQPEERVQQVQVMPPVQAR